MRPDNNGGPGLKAAIVGLGQAGKRHAENLKALGHNISYVSKRKLDVYPLYAQLEECLHKENPELVVVANKTAEHFETLSLLKKWGHKGKVLVEKPIGAGPQKTLEEDFSCFQGQLAVAYNLRFHPLIQKLRNLLLESSEEDSVCSVLAYCGSYLPDWPSYANYNDCTSAHRSSGGGVLRDLSHELDYLHWIFGDLKVLFSQGGQVSNLPISSDDVWGLSLSSKRCPLIQLQLNYLDRRHRREIIVLTTKHTYKLDLVNNAFFVDQRPLEGIIAEVNTYKEEMKAIIKGDFSSLCTFEEGLKTLRLIETIEKMNKGMEN